MLCTIRKRVINMYTREINRIHYQIMQDMQKSDTDIIMHLNGQEYLACQTTGFLHNISNPKNYHWRKIDNSTSRYWELYNEFSNKRVFVTDNPDDFWNKLPEKLKQVLN